MFIDQQHTSKLLKTAMAYAAVLKFSSYHPDTVLLLTATEEYHWRKILSVQCTDNKYTLNRIIIYEEFGVLLTYPQQFYKDCLYQ